MKYLKVFTEFASNLEDLNDVEVGRLFRAMLKYAEDGTEGELKGNERFLWKIAKKNIDNQRNAYDRMCETNRKNVTNRYESLRVVTDGNESLRAATDGTKYKNNINKNKNIINIPPIVPPRGQSTQTNKSKRHSEKGVYQRKYSAEELEHIGIDLLDGE